MGKFLSGMKLEPVVPFGADCQSTSRIKVTAWTPHGSAITGFYDPILFRKALKELDTKIKRTLDDVVQIAHYENNTERQKDNG